MTTLPMLTLNKNKPQSYLRFPTSTQPEIGRASLEQHTCDVMNHRKYLYIDFQTQNKIFELEKADQKTHEEDEAELIGTSHIGGFQELSKMSPSGYRMHKFLSEERLYFERKNKWKSLLKNRDNSNQIDFSKIRQKINPQKLEDYLQNKHNEDNWKKIQERQQKLYEQISNQNVPLTRLDNSRKKVNINRSRIKVKAQFRKIKLKALDKLNSLIVDS